MKAWLKGGLIGLFVWLVYIIFLITTSGWHPGFALPRGSPQCSFAECQAPWGRAIESTIDFPITAFSYLPVKLEAALFGNLNQPGMYALVVLIGIPSIVGFFLVGAIIGWLIVKIKSRK